MRKRRSYSDSVADPKTTWSNKMAVEELIKSWPCNKEWFIHIESHFLTRQARQRQFQRAQHVGEQGKGWLILVDVMKLLAGPRKWILGSTHEFINKTGRAGESKEESNKEDLLLGKDKNQGHKEQYRKTDWTQPWKSPGPSATLWIPLLSRGTGSDSKLIRPVLYTSFKTVFSNIWYC